MGLADERDGIYLFNPVSDPETVRALVDWARERLESGDVEIPAELQTRLEARISADSIPRIPFQDET